MHKILIFFFVSTKSGTTWSYSIHPHKSKQAFPKSHPLVRLILMILSTPRLHANNQTPDMLTSPPVSDLHVLCFSTGISAQDSRMQDSVHVQEPKGCHGVTLAFYEQTNITGYDDLFSSHVFAQFCNGQITCGPFWDHILEYWSQIKENSNKILFMKFEDLKRDPEFYLRRLAEFLECLFSAEEEGSGMLEEISRLCSFESLSSLEINQTGKLSIGIENKAFFRRGEVGDSEDYLTDEMIDKLDEISEKKFGG